MTWNAAVPAGTDNIRDGDNAIRELKTDLATALSAYGHFPINVSAPKFQYKGQSGATGSRPTNGEGGIYFDTTTATIVRDNGSSWDQVGINFASGTALCFYQASAPTGWTKQTIQNDKFLRVVSGTGGGTGGSWVLASEASHTHSGPNHIHTVAAHNHQWVENSGDDTWASDGVTTRNFDTINNVATGGSTVVANLDGASLDLFTKATSLTTDLGGNGSTGAGSSHTHTHGSTQHAYVDVIICTKD